MLGMKLLADSFGFDPEKIQAEVNAAAEFGKQQLAEIRAQLNRIEANQILLYHLMVKAGVIEEIKPETAGEIDHESRVN